MTTREASYEPGFFAKALVGIFKVVNKYVPWHKLPTILGALNLDALRIELRAYNLHDGYATGEPQGNAETVSMTDERFLHARNSEGKYNSLELPHMGCAGMRFGRNFPREHCQAPTEEELWNPNPRMLGETFMTRTKFIPATTLNLLAAAWIQFQTHDWFVHELDDDEYDIPLPEGDGWSPRKMMLPKTKPDAVQHSSDTRCPGYQNKNTAWWDSSQIYGGDETTTQSLREKDKDGKLMLTEDNREKFLPRDQAGNVLTGLNSNWWLGLELLHTLFALEHNSICDKLREAHPDWTGDYIFDKARLVNCALIAKIHTVEWTPAILGHPALKLSMNANWWGIVGKKLTKALGRISKTNEVISGIPGSGADQRSVPYSLTEEFVSVYRMHSLIPDSVALLDATSGAHKETLAIEDTLFTKSQDIFEHDANFADVFYSFGINYPGAITNFNYPNFMREVVPPDGIRRDLGTVDILRDRERGVPRYCQFRRLLRMDAPKTFEELTGGDVELAQKLSDAYGGDIELVDTLIGSHSEPLPAGFGFSDTAFRIFILMASRRLKSDRFIATQWNEEMYTKEGFAWVQNTGMKDVLKRHFPELAPVLDKSQNVFAPWKMHEASKEYTGIETNAPS